MDERSETYRKRKWIVIDPYGTGRKEDRERRMESSKV
jgi:hypothetical protein